MPTVETKRCLDQAIYRYRADWNAYMAATYDDDDPQARAQPARDLGNAGRRLFGGCDRQGLLAA
jgi:hypothetical protein